MNVEKDPQKVRAALIDAAAVIIADQGLAKMTVEAVARRAGVTKGGLFHHFQSKQDLIDGVVDAMLALADATMDAAMAADPEPRGRFTRAYLRAQFADKRLTDDVRVRSICLATIGDPMLQGRWVEWVRARLVRHADTDANPHCALVRLAADGIWLRSLHDTAPPEPVTDQMIDALLALTIPDYPTHLSEPDATPGSTS